MLASVAAGSATIAEYHSLWTDLPAQRKRKKKRKKKKCCGQVDNQKFYKLLEVDQSASETEVKKACAFSTGCSKRFLKNVG